MASNYPERISFSHCKITDATLLATCAVLSKEILCVEAELQTKITPLCLQLALLFQLNYITILVCGDRTETKVMPGRVRAVVLNGTSRMKWSVDLSIYLLANLASPLPRETVGIWVDYARRNLNFLSHIN
jgi:hypothetical protein